MPCFCTTIMMEPSLTSLIRPELPTSVGDSALRWEIIDNDGWPDIYVANYGKNRLYHNNHDGTFTDVAEKAGVTLGGWSAGPTWGDYDRDGRLDLFVPGYVDFDLKHLPVEGEGGVPAVLCRFRGIKVMCGPRGLQGESDHLFHNNGDGTFTDVSVKAGVSDPNKYYGFASVFVDVDDDGWLDLAVANDSVPNYLYHNLHNGTFRDDSYTSGFALTEDGREQASMGIAVGDYNRDGKVDLYVTSFSDDYNSLYRNDGGGSFSEVTYQAGLSTSDDSLSWAGARAFWILITTVCPIFLSPTAMCTQGWTNRIGGQPLRSVHSSFAIGWDKI